ncbi:MAG: hypothetical protein CVU04_00375 [Bacteroidetes bacterium HGW-Bacteroidetes-20]|nr:MAG: hypothetical protein CVU04_00375 [Bacteroidetes bacterium HGW-Bacteroidetes-20]
MNKKPIVVNQIFYKSPLIIAMLTAMITLFNCSTLKQQPTSKIEVDSTLDSVFTEINQPTETIPQLTTSDFKKLYEYNYKWLTYRAKVEYTYEGNVGTCNLFFVNRIDSLIYININISGIEIVRIVFTPQQVTYVNKLNKTYFQGSYFFIEKIAKVPLNFYTIQSLFNGKDFPNYEQNFSITKFQDSTILYSPKRIDAKNGGSMKQTLVLNNLFQIIHNLIELESISKNLSIQYFQYLPISDNTIFQSMIINSVDFNFNIELKNIRFNTPGPTSITIPESFSPIKFQPKL